MLLESQIVALMPAQQAAAPLRRPVAADAAAGPVSDPVSGAVSGPPPAAPAEQRQQPPERGPILAPALGERARRALALSNAAEGGAPSRAAGAEPGGTLDKAPNALTPAEQDLVDRLAARDREVRAHEQAHARVGGQYAGSPSYTYQTGPDGKRYAIGGSVAIDVSPVPGDPEATIAKMEQVKAAALAPAEPSSADRRIATLAEAASREAQAVLASMRRYAVLEAAAEGRSVDDGGQTAMPAVPALAFSPMDREIGQRA
ncbi:MAG: putative metalloprotease CJM1_0395 family protein [Pseudomonadota bacterium]